MSKGLSRSETLAKSRHKARRKAPSSAIRMQRKALQLIEDSLMVLHFASLDEMVERGILPPFYGGDHLKDHSEVIPLWGYKDENGDPALALVMLRLLPDAEPNADLRDVREDLGFENDLRAVDVLAQIFGDRTNTIGGVERMANTDVALVFSGEQLTPAPGLDLTTMLEHISDGRPYAVIPIFPVSEVDDEIVPDFSAVDRVRVEVLYADSPELLEAAVWHYRLQLGLNIDAEVNLLQGGPLDEDTITSVVDLVAMYETLVVNGLRLYGSTSPLRNQQEKLDVMREENGDLVVPGPLKPEIEPVALLAEKRAHSQADAGPEFLHVPGDKEPLLSFWPQVRAYRYFSIRLRYGIIDDKTRSLLGFDEVPALVWVMADDLNDIYRLVHLMTLRELLFVTGNVSG